MVGKQRPKQKWLSVLYYDNGITLAEWKAYNLWQSGKWGCLRPRHRKGIINTNNNKSRCNY